MFGLQGNKCVDKTYQICYEFVIWANRKIKSIFWKL